MFLTGLGNAELFPCIVQVIKNFKCVKLCKEV